MLPESLFVSPSVEGMYNFFHLRELLVLSASSQEKARRFKLPHSNGQTLCENQPVPLGISCLAVLFDLSTLKMRHGSDDPCYIGPL